MARAARAVLARGVAPEVAPRARRARARACGGGERATPWEGPQVAVPRNVLGGELECCCANVRGTGIGTGFYRDGFCSTGADDVGRHTVCIVATAEFLAFSASVGNPLHAPVKEYMFPGVAPGDRWCLCASRWAQAHAAGAAPPLILRATHEATLRHARLEDIMAFAVDSEEAKADVERLDAMREKLARSVDMSDE